MATVLLTEEQFRESRKLGEEDKEGAEQAYAKYVAETRTRDADALYAAHRCDGWMRERYDPTVVAAQHARRQKAAGATVEELVRDAGDGALADKISEGYMYPALDGVTFNAQRTQAAKMSYSCLYFRPFSAEVQYEDLLRLVSRLDGFSDLWVSGPFSRTANLRFKRCAWVKFETEDTARKAESTLRGANVPLKAYGALQEVVQSLRESIADESLLGPELTLPARLGGALASLSPRIAPVQVSFTRARPLRTMPSSALGEKQIESDLELATDLATALDKELGAGDVDAVLEAAAKLTLQQRLNTVLLYLRQAHQYCFYSGTQCASVGDMVSECWLGYTSNGVEAQAASEETAETPSYVLAAKARLDQATESAAAEAPTVTSIDFVDADAAVNGEGVGKTSQYMSSLPSGVYAGKAGAALASAHAAAAAERAEKACASLVDSVEELYFSSVSLEKEPGSPLRRCALCQKLFKDHQFVMKHIRNKHQDRLQQGMDLKMNSLKEAVEFHIGDHLTRRAYFSDEARPMPLSAASAVGRERRDRDRDRDRGRDRDRDPRGGFGGRGGYGPGPSDGFFGGGMAIPAPGGVFVPMHHAPMGGPMGGPMMRSRGPMYRDADAVVEAKGAPTAPTYTRDLVSYDDL